MAFSRKIQNMIAEFRGLPIDRSYSRPREIVGIDSVIEVLTEKYRFDKVSVEETIVRNWKSIVGDYASQRCAPQRLMDNGSRLLIYAANTVIRQELTFAQKDIVGRLRRLPDCNTIQSVVIRCG